MKEPNGGQFGLDGRDCLAGSGAGSHDQPEENQTLLSGPTMYSVSIYFQVKPIWREDILRRRPFPFPPNLHRPKMQA